jgi:hypothetical protein
MSKPKKGSAKKVYFTLSANGKKTYAPKATFAKNNGNNVRTVKAQNKVPNKLLLKRLPGAKKVSAPSNMAPANARRARANAMAAKRNNGAMKPAAKRVRAAPKPRAAPKRKSPNYEAKATKMFAKIMNKKAPVRKARAPKKAAVSPAMKLLLKINAENRRIISKNKTLLAKAKRGRKANSPGTYASKMFAKMTVTPKRKVRKAPLKKRVNNLKKNFPANKNPFALLMKPMRVRKAAKK